MRTQKSRFFPRRLGRSQFPARLEESGRRRLLGGALTLGVLLATPSVAQTPADTFSEQTDVIAIEIPVQVTLDGEPLRGLTQDDFQVSERRKQHSIVQFDVVDVSQVGVSDDVASGAAQDIDMPSMSARRHFLLLFDLAFSSPDAVTRAQDAVLEFIDAGLHPSDLLAVATFSSQGGARLLHTFTSDRKQARLAVETLGLPKLTRTVSDPLGLLFGDLEAAEAGFSSGRGSGLVRETLEDVARAMERQERNQYEDRVRVMTASMERLAGMLRLAPGRKHVLFLSEGFDNSVFFGEEDVETRNRQNQSLESGRVWEVSSEDRFGDSRAQNALEDMLRAFRRADSRIDTVDIGGIRASTDATAGGRRAVGRRNADQRSLRDSLATLAGSTGGHFVQNHNDLPKAMAEIQRLTSVTYVLTIQPQGLVADGNYRRLKVRLNDGPKGAKLVHRPGYYAPKPWQELEPAERQLLAASRMLDDASEGDLQLGLTASALPMADPTEAGKAGGKAYVPLMIEIDGAPLVAASGEAASMAGQIFLYAIDGAGQVRAFLDHALQVDLTQARATLGGSGLKFFGDLELTPGHYTLRAFVRHQGSDQNGFARLDLRVPDFRGGEAGALRPLFPEPPGSWMMLREEPVAGVAPPPFPYLNGGQPFLPAARPAFAPSRVDVALAVHNLAQGQPQLNARVLDAAEQETSAKIKPLAKSPAADPDRPGLGRWPLQVDARRLAPGPYTLEVTVRDEAGLNSVQRTPFTILEESQNP